MRTKAKDEIEQFLTYGGFGQVESEYRFHPTRRWRADWALVDHKIMIEYDGVTGATGFNRRGDESSVGHISVNGVLRDAEKSNEAQLLGWVCLRVNAVTIKSGKAFEWIEKAVEQRRVAVSR